MGRIGGAGGGGDEEYVCDVIEGRLGGESVAGKAGRGGRYVRGGGNV